MLICDESPQHTSALWTLALLCFVRALASMLRLLLLLCLAPAAHCAAAVQLLSPFTLRIPAASIPSPGTPFNSSSLGTRILFTAPSGRAIPVLPFYTQDFERSQDGSGAEVLAAAGAPYFAARLAPQELGEYAYVQQGAPAGVAPLAGGFTCAGGPARAGDGYAFARNRKFTLDNATAWWAVGENMAWPGAWPYFNGSAAFDNATGASYMYDRYLPRLAAAGGNWIRLWLGPSLVRDVAYDGEQGSFLPMALAAKVPWGALNLQAAWRIEHVLELCRALGVKATLVMESQQCFGASSTKWGFFDACAFNAANGGPLAAGESPFTSAPALAALAARWQYVLARWGYATSVFSFELQNEADDAQWPGGFDAAALAAAAAQAAALRASDPYGHMIDNSFGGTAPLAGPVHAWEALPTTAFTSVHAYGMADVAAAVWGSVTRHAADLDRPCFMEEFGADWHGPLQHAEDPRGVGMHTGAWASLAGGAAGSAMVWFWAETDGLGTYGRLAGAAAAARALAAPLLALHWSTWPGGGVNSSAVAAGWTVGVGAAGELRGVLAYVYNVNFTQRACGRGQCVLDVGGVVALSLQGLPAPSPGAALQLRFFNTTSGEVLLQQRQAPAAAAAAGGGGGGGGGGLVVVFPRFDQDMALYAEWVGGGEEGGEGQGQGARALPAPAPPALQFAGYTWGVKAGSALGPGPNTFAAANARVNGAGQLVLRLAPLPGGGWGCAEVVLNRSLGFGRYEWQLAAAPAGWDASIVLGLFTYESDSRELDIEFSGWGGAFPGANADFAVQPSGVRRFEAPAGGGGALSASYVWGPGGVNFSCGGAEWAYTGPDTPPSSGGERVHINLWLFRGRAPASGEGAEVVVTDFSFTPL